MAEANFALAGRRVYVAGHRGMVGSACVRRLEREGCEIVVAARDRVDLTDQAATEEFIAEARPEVVVVAAAKVGGILANNASPASFLYENLMIEANLIHAAWRVGVAKLLFLGSSCIYPREAPQPIVENALLTGPLEFDQRMVCRRQDCRDQAVSGLPPPIWLRLHQRHAVQPLRPE